MDPNAIQITLSSPAGVADWVQMAASVVQTVGIVAASFAAVLGINSWRKEFQGKRRIELAENILSMMYKAKDAIASVRSPFSYESESKGRQVGDNETYSQKKARDHGYIVIQRYNEHIKTFNKLYSMRYRAMALMGKDAAKPIEEIKRINAEIVATAESLYDVSEDLSDSDQASSKECKDYIKDCNKILGWVSHKDDQIGERVESAISQMESTCRGVIEGTLSEKH